MLTTGRSSITTFVLTSVDWWLYLWPSAKLQPYFGFEMKLSCRGHDHALPFAYDLFWVSTYLIWNQTCTCVHMHTEDRKRLWLFIVAALRWRHDFPSTIFCIHNVHDKLYCSMSNYHWKCFHFRNVLCHSIKVWSSWLMNVNRWDIALIILVALVHTGPTVVAKLSLMWLEIYSITFFHYFISKQIQKHNFS